MAKKQPDHTHIQCLRCQMAIDLASQECRSIKACPWCGDRTFLLNLTTRQAAHLYNIDPASLGGRLRQTHQFE